MRHSARFDLCLLVSYMPLAPAPSYFCLYASPSCPETVSVVERDAQIAALAQRQAPLLLIHGDNDNNAGTHPMQSERMVRVRVSETYTSSAGSCYRNPRLYHA